MHPFLQRLSAALERTGFWESPAVVAVSGGADSVALLCGLERLAPASARLVVAHARHDIRSDAPDDERFVASLAARLGIECVARSITVRDDLEHRGEGLEARARRLRYEFLLDVARTTGARRVAVGHTADDQAETILHRIFRGTGVAGLAGMRPARALGDGIALVRPMLRLSRELGRSFLATHGEQWREDLTNADPRHARNFIRHEILDRAVRGPYAAASAAIVRLGAQADRSSAAIASAVEHFLDLHTLRQADGRVVLDAMAVAALDRHLLAHLVAALWQREGWPRRDMTALHHEAVADLVVTVGRGDRPAMPAIDLPGGVRAAASSGRRIEFRHAPRPSVVQ